MISMWNFVSVFATALLIVASGASAALATEYRFATQQEGRDILMGEEAWFAGLGSAEIAIRMESPVPDKTAQDLKTFYAAEILAWTPEEIAAQRAVIDELGATLAPWTHLLPDTVWFVKMSNKIEGGMPHTRSNAIFLPAMGEHASANLFLHELFHVLSRAQSARRDALYNLIGFEPCQLEETEWMKRRRLSNPDVPSGAYYLDVEGDNPDAIIPWLHAAHDAFGEDIGGGFGGHFGFGLLSVTVAEGKCTPLQAEPGIPVILPPSDVPAFFEAIGHNTGYIIHPEEVLAVNFVFLATAREGLPNPEIIERLRQWLGDGSELDK